MCNMPNLFIRCRSFVYDGIRASFPKLELDDCFASKDEIATHVLQDLRTSMQIYGYDIVNTLITDITPDATVQRAMNEINGRSRLLCVMCYRMCSPLSLPL